MMYENKSGATVGQIFDNIPRHFKLDTLFENDLSHSGLKGDYTTMMSKVPLMFRAYMPNTDIEMTKIGDVNSNERGSGARYNQGKPDFSLIPLKILADSTKDYVDVEVQHIAKAVAAVGKFQMRQTTNDRDTLQGAVAMLSEHLPACADVFNYGRKKYAAWNWAKGMAWSIPIACIGRHFYQLAYHDEKLDSESDLSHVGHILCNIIMLIWYLDNYQEGDDRYAPPPVEG